MHKLTFTLRQHTPLIHFQWEQAGATIRPPELKSKLDKWILQRKTNCYGLSDELLKVVKMDETITPWIKGIRKKDHPALDYKVTVVAYGDNQFKEELNTRVDNVTKRDGSTKKEVVEKDYPPFFANQMKQIEWETGAKKIKRLSYYSAVTIIFETANDELRKEIIKEFPKFLLHSNFGTRQSKGFGCFYLDKSDAIFPEKDGKTDEDFFMKSFDYCFDITAKGGNDIEKVKDLFAQIDLFYKTLRGGIHPRGMGIYFKSLMWKYAQALESQWDKRTIKKNLFPSEQISHEYGKEINSPVKWDGAASNPIFLWRDLLGLSSDQQWMGYKWTDHNHQVKDESITKESVDKENNKPKYTRFKSPIFFKPIRTGPNRYRIFFEVPKSLKQAFVNSSFKVPEQEILGKVFNINSKGHGNFNIPYPEYFDYNQFFKIAFSTNPKEYVKTGNGKNLEILQAIYSQLAYQVEQKNK